MKKIAIICPAELPVPSIKGGAVETLIDHFLNENEKQKKKALEIIVYSVYDVNAERESKKYKNVKFKYFRINERLKKIYFLYLRLNRKILKRQVADYFLRKVIKDLNNEEVDKIIIEGNFQQVIPIKRIKKDTDIYLHIHGDAFFKYNKLLDKAISRCNKIITVSEYVKKNGVVNYNNNKSKFVAVKNCIDIEKFKKIYNKNDEKEIRAKYNIKDDEVIILFCGRIIKEKGVSELIKAFNKYCLKTNAKMIIVGNAGFGNEVSTDYDKEIRLLAEEAKERIIFTGFIHNKKLPLIYKIADISVIPSLCNEAFGLVALEAMAAGIPIIATNTGGIPEVVNDKCARLIENDNNIIDSLGKELLYLINNREKRIEMGIEGLNKVEEFSLSNYYNNIVQVINSKY